MRPQNWCHFGVGSAPLRSVAFASDVCLGQRFLSGVAVGRLSNSWCLVYEVYAMLVIRKWGLEVVRK